MLVSGIEKHLEENQSKKWFENSVFIGELLFSTIFLKYIFIRLSCPVVFQWVGIIFNNCLILFSNCVSVELQYATMSDWNHSVIADVNKVCFDYVSICELIYANLLCK